MSTRFLLLLSLLLLSRVAVADTGDDGCRTIQPPAGLQAATVQVDLEIKKPDGGEWEPSTKVAYARSFCEILPPSPSPPPPPPPLAPDGSHPAAPMTTHLSSRNGTKAWWEQNKWCGRGTSFLGRASALNLPAPLSSSGKGTLWFRLPAVPCNKELPYYQVGVAMLLVSGDETYYMRKMLLPVTHDRWLSQGIALPDGEEQLKWFQK